MAGGLPRTSQRIGDSRLVFFDVSRAAVAVPHDTATNAASQCLVILVAESRVRFALWQRRLRSCARDSKFC